MKANL